MPRTHHNPAAGLGRPAALDTAAGLGRPVAGEGLAGRLPAADHTGSFLNKSDRNLVLSSFNRQATCIKYFLVQGWRGGGEVSYTVFLFFDYV